MQQKPPEQRATLANNLRLPYSRNFTGDDAFKYYAPYITAPAQQNLSPLSNTAASNPIAQPDLYNEHTYYTGYKNSFIDQLPKNNAGGFDTTSEGQAKFDNLLGRDINRQFTNLAYNTNAKDKWAFTNKFLDYLSTEPRLQGYKPMVELKRSHYKDLYDRIASEQKKQEELHLSGTPYSKFKNAFDTDMERILDKDYNAFVNKGASDFTNLEEFFRNAGYVSKDFQDKVLQQHSGYLPQMLKEGDLNILFKATHDTSSPDVLQRRKALFEKLLEKKPLTNAALNEWITKYYMGERPSEGTWSFARDVENTLQRLYDDITKTPPEENDLPPSTTPEDIKNFDQREKSPQISLSQELAANAAALGIPFPVDLETQPIAYAKELENFVNDGGQVLAQFVEDANNLALQGDKKWAPAAEKLAAQEFYPLFQQHLVYGTTPKNFVELVQNAIEDAGGIAEYIDKNKGKPNKSLSSNKYGSPEEFFQSLQSQNQYFEKHAETQKQQNKIVAQIKESPQKIKSTVDDSIKTITLSPTSSIPHYEGVFSNLRAKYPVLSNVSAVENNLLNETVNNTLYQVYAENPNLPPDDRGLANAIRESVTPYVQNAIMNYTSDAISVLQEQIQDLMSELSPNGGLTGDALRTEIQRLTEPTKVHPVELYPLSTLSDEPTIGQEVEYTTSEPIRLDQKYGLSKKAYAGALQNLKDKGEITSLDAGMPLTNQEVAYPHARPMKVQQIYIPNTAPERIPVDYSHINRSFAPAPSALRNDVSTLSDAPTTMEHDVRIPQVGRLDLPKKLRELCIKNTEIYTLCNKILEDEAKYVGVTQQQLKALLSNGHVTMGVGDVPITYSIKEHGYDRDSYKEFISTVQKKQEQLLEKRKQWVPKGKEARKFAKEMREGLYDAAKYAGRSIGEGLGYIADKVGAEVEHIKELREKERIALENEMALKEEETAKNREWFSNKTAEFGEATKRRLGNLVDAGGEGLYNVVKYAGNTVYNITDGIVSGAKAIKDDLDPYVKSAAKYIQDKRLRATIPPYEEWEKSLEKSLEDEDFNITLTNNAETPSILVTPKNTNIDEHSRNITNINEKLHDIDKINDDIEDKYGINIIPNIQADLQINNNKTEVGNVIKNTILNNMEEAAVSAGASGVDAKNIATFLNNLLNNNATALDFANIINVPDNALNSAVTSLPEAEQKQLQENIQTNMPKYIDIAARNVDGTDINSYKPSTSEIQQNKNEALVKVKDEVKKQVGAKSEGQKLSSPEVYSVAVKNMTNDLNEISKGDANVLATISPHKSIQEWKDSAAKNKETVGEVRKFIQDKPRLVYRKDKYNNGMVKGDYHDFHISDNDSRFITYDPKNLKVTVGDDGQYVYTADPKATVSIPVHNIPNPIPSQVPFILDPVYNKNQRIQTPKTYPQNFKYKRGAFLSKQFNGNVYVDQTPNTIGIENIVKDYVKTYYLRNNLAKANATIDNKPLSPLEPLTIRISGDPEMMPDRVFSDMEGKVNEFVDMLPNITFKGVQYPNWLMDFFGRPESAQPANLITQAKSHNIDISVAEALLPKYDTKINELSDLSNQLTKLYAAKRALLAKESHGGKNIVKKILTVAAALAGWFVGAPLFAVGAGLEGAIASGVVGNMAGQIFANNKPYSQSAEAEREIQSISNQINSVIAAAEAIDKEIWSSVLSKIESEAK